MNAQRKQLLVLALVIATVAFGFFLRTYWNADAAQTEDGQYLLSGNDPYYHKHAVDHIVSEWETIEFDPMLNYPIGSVNPNPPLFEWSIAVGSQALEPFAESEEQAVWWSTLYAPALWGALTIIPMFLIGRMFAGAWGGLLAAFLLATSPEHMSRTNLGFSDHDAMVIFLITFGMYFALRSVREVGERSEHIRAQDLGAGYLTWFKTHRVAAGSAILAGGFWGALSLVWKGFPYVFGVVLAYAGIAFLVSHWRNKDTAYPFFALATALGIAVLMGLPYYAGFGLMHFWNPALFLFLALVVAGIFFVATQEYPSVLVVPGMLVIAGLFAVVMFVLVPDIANALLNRFIYFRQTRLYETIAEAHPADLSSLAFSVGPMPFFFYIGGFFWLGYRVWTKKRPAEVFFLVWALVDFYMAVSAVRFLSQSVPSMALLASATTVWLVRSLDLPNVIERFRSSGGGWRGIRRSTSTLQILTVIMVLLVTLPSLAIAYDAAVPSNIENRRAQEARQNAVEDVRERAEALGESQENIEEYVFLVQRARDADHFRDLLQDAQLRLGLDSRTVNSIHDAASAELDTVGRFSKRLGAFGTGFLPSGWRNVLNQLATYDNDQPPTERPGFLAWWDYGHWSIAVGKHPAVADNFQNGYRTTGAFIAAQNESHALQIMAARQSRIMDEGTFTGILVDLGVDRFEAERYYDRYQVEAFPYIPFSADEAEATAASAELVRRVEAETGKPIRYFAVDNRMLPVDNPSTEFIESSGIFYAPVTLAGLEPDDYVEAQLLDLNTGREVSDAELRAIQRQAVNEQPNLANRLVYKAPFFESMFYRGFMGLPAQQPLEQQGQQAPNPFLLAQFHQFYEDDRMLRADGTVSGMALSNEVAPGFGLRHFRLVEANEAVRMLEFYNGAVLEGRVTVAGQPMEGVRVTAFDDAGELVLGTNPDYFDAQNRTAQEMDVPHDSTVTDADGSYRLVAPFSTGRGVTVKVTQEVPAGPAPVLATETLDISRAQAESQDRIELELAIEPAEWAGVAFLDVNTNGVLDEGEDRLGNATITVQNRTFTTNDDGSFVVTDLAPGRHDVTAELEGYRLRGGANRVNLAGGEPTQSNLTFEFVPASVTGTVEDQAGRFVEGVRVGFQPAANQTTARVASAFSQINGTLSVSLQPGTYDVGGNGTDFQTNETLEVVGIDVVAGDGAEVNDAGQLVVQPNARGVEVVVTVERRPGGASA